MGAPLCVKEALLLACIIMHISGELLIRCKRRQSLGLYVKIDCFLPKQNNILISSLFCLYFVQQ